jgi:hypothetical protein
MTQIISVATIKTTVGLAGTVEDRKLQPFVDGVQLSVEKMLGQTLYGELITAIIADPTLATEADLKELRDDYIAPYIAWAVYLQSLSRLYAEFDRNGAHYKNDGNTVQADAAWLRMEQATARDNSDKYADRLLDFLKDNSDTGQPFASWRTVTDTEQGERINKTYGVGIVTRRSKWQNSQR